MVSFTYEIKDELGLHARPAGLLVKESAKWKSTVTLDNGTKKADARRIMGIMGMGVKKGHTITVSVEGEDEAACAEAMKAFFEANL